MKSKRGLRRKVKTSQKKNWIGRNYGRENCASFSFRKEYAEIFGFLKECKHFIYSVILVFFGFALLGFAFPAPEVVSEAILDFLEQLMKEIEGLSYFGLFSYIFFNNLKASFLGMVLGVFFGLFPILFALFNGYVLGFVSSKVVSSESFFALFNLLPHGIFELPAVFISLGLGVRLGALIFENRRQKENFKELFLNCLKTFVLVVIPLLLIAAIIEASFMVFGG